MKLLLVILLAIIVSLISWQKLFAPEPTLLIGGEVIKIELANTEAERSRGLSGHPPLEANQGMLFVFDTPTTPGFWMKEMLFSIDLIWLDENWQIVDLTLNATPESYPQIFTPLEPIKYVLEVAAGFATKHQLKIGDTVIKP